MFRNGLTNVPREEIVNEVDQIVLPNRRLTICVVDNINYVMFNLESENAYRTVTKGKKFPVD